MNSLAADAARIFPTGLPPATLLLNHHLATDPSCEGLPQLRSQVVIYHWNRSREVHVTVMTGKSIEFPLLSLLTNFDDIDELEASEGPREASRIHQFKCEQKIRTTFFD